MKLKRGTKTANNSLEKRGRGNIQILMLGTIQPRQKAISLSERLHQRVQIGSRYTIHTCKNWTRNWVREKNREFLPKKKKTKKNRLMKTQTEKWIKFICKLLRESYIRKCININHLYLHLYSAGFDGPTWTANGIERYSSTMYTSCTLCTAQNNWNNLTTSPDLISSALYSKKLVETWEQHAHRQPCGDWNPCQTIQIRNQLVYF